jgi:threonine dehydrogenase-like Zn-dependent dehydrogenase
LKALTFGGPGKVQLGSVPDPSIQHPGDAVLRVRLAAVCGSDLHVYRGREEGLDPGTVMGHELVGEVLEVGNEVRSVKPGDRVACPFTTSCGSCFYCLRGLTARCVSGQLLGWVEGGTGLQGTQAERVRVPLADTTLVGLPDAISDEAGLLLGDVLPTGYFCADLAGVGDGGVYVIVGCGPVGLMAVAAARQRGARRVVAIDSVPERLAIAGELGARPLNHQEDSAIELVHSLTSGRGADAVLEAVGSPAATRLAVDLVRPGGVIASVGVHTEEHLAFSPAEAYDRNLTYRSGRCPARHYMDRLLPLVAEGCFPIQAILSHRLPLDEGPRAYEIFDTKRDGCTKVVLEP